VRPLVYGRLKWGGGAGGPTPLRYGVDKIYEKCRVDSGVSTTKFGVWRLQKERNVYSEL